MTDRNLPLFFLATVVIAAFAFMAGLRHGAVTPPAPMEVEHHAFYNGRTRIWAGDSTTEVEVFRDPEGQWVACVWRRGKCWRGQLKLRSGAE